MEPAGQATQAGVPGRGVKLLSAQGVQVTAAATGASKPAAQASQSGAPGAPEAVPGAQGAQAAWPRSGAYSPSTHRAQEKPRSARPPSFTLPAAHTEHPSAAPGGSAAAEARTSDDAPLPLPHSANGLAVGRAPSIASALES
jgi:hypothetical protein